jgi:hypothetical protein
MVVYELREGVVSEMAGSVVGRLVGLDAGLLEG